MDTDSPTISLNTNEGLFADLTQSSKDLGFHKLDPSHKLYSEDNKQVIGKLKLETAPEIELDEAVFLTSRSYNYRRSSDSIKQKKGVQSHKNML